MLNIKKNFMVVILYAIQSFKIKSLFSGLCRWVIAMYHYDCAAKFAAPKKQQLAEASEDLQIANTALEVSYIYACKTAICKFFFPCE
jgi:hypothetical protein